MKYKSSLSMKRIVISLIIFALIPAVRAGIFRITGNDTIAFTFAVNLAGTCLIVYDWNLFGIHYNRAKSAIFDTAVYTLIGTVLIGGLTMFGRRFLMAYIPLPDPVTVHTYMFALPPIILAYSFVLGTVINISFKCLTVLDKPGFRFVKMDIRDRELLIILASGFLFGLCYTAAFAPLQDMNLLIRTYLYNVLLVSSMSYLYNQSNSFIPGILSFTAIMLVLQIITLF